MMCVSYISGISRTIVHMLALISVMAECVWMPIIGQNVCAHRRRQGALERLIQLNADEGMLAVCPSYQSILQLPVLTVIVVCSPQRVLG